MFFQSDSSRFLFLRILKEEVHAMEVLDHDNLINHTEVAAAEIRNLPKQQVKSGAQFDITVRSVCSRREDTSNICCDVHSVCWQVPTTRTECTKKKYSEVTTEKCNKRQNVLSVCLSFILSFFLCFFTCKQGDKSTCYIKRTVSFCKNWQA
jgi:hypothetical protein